METLERIKELQAIRLDYQNYILAGEMTVDQYEEEENLLLLTKEVKGD